jgi:hypothetical protein
MSWIGSSTKPAPSKPQAVKTVASLEFATTVSARGIAPANAVIERLTASECRFRTVVFFEHGEVIEVPFTTRQHVRVLARGTVVSRTQNGPRFVYTLRLDRMSGGEVDELARTMAESYRRQALSRSHEEAVRKLPTTERLSRTSVRVVTEFPVVYRTPKEAYRDARAGDVSSGGMLLVCKEALVEGEPLELRFTLPSDALKALPEETAVIDGRRGTATPVRDDLRRPFEEMTVGARVVSHRPLGNHTFAYGLAFTCLDGFMREELARYTHAVGRARNRH